MEMYEGLAVRPGVAIAAAARLRTEYGIPSLDPQRLRRVGERMRAFGVEVPDLEQVIVIADVLPAGFALAPVPGFEYVGVAAEAILGGPELLPCPAVAGLPDTLLQTVEEDDIIIVDGDRGRVYLSPDAATLARYQSPLRRARRFFLDSSHLPARTTSDDRPVAVLGCVTDWESAQSAVDGGADGLWILPSNDIVGGPNVSESSEDQWQSLRALMDLVAGKPLFLQIPTERLSLSALLRAAGLGGVHLVLEDLSLRAELGKRLEELEGALEEQDLPFGSVRFEAGAATQEEAEAPESLDDYAGLCVTDRIGEARMERLLPLAGLTQHAKKPLTLLLPLDDWETPLAEALDLGADRVVMSPDAVADVKDFIRTS